MLDSLFETNKTKRTTSSSAMATQSSYPAGIRGMRTARCCGFSSTRTRPSNLVVVLSTMHWTISSGSLGSSATAPWRC